MKYQKLIVTLGLCAVCLGSAAHAKSFRIDVSVNGQPAFTDCLIFEADHRLQLERGSLELAWVSDPAAAQHFMATTDGANVDTTPRLTLHAGIYGGRYVVGNAVNSYGQTYMFMGRAESCGPEEALSLPGDADYAAVPVETFAPTRVAPANRPDLAAGIVDDEPCFGFKCGPPPAPLAVDGETGGQASVVSGGSYKVYLQSYPKKTGKPLEDCWVFENTGTLRNRLGAELVWRADRYNTDQNSFQSVATVAATHGMAFHGRATDTGALTVSGIRAVGGKVTAYIGSAFPVRGC